MQRVKFNLDFICSIDPLFQYEFSKVFCLYQIQTFTTVSAKIVCQYRKYLSVNLTQKMDQLLILFKFLYYLNNHKSKQIIYTKNMQNTVITRLVGLLNSFLYQHRNYHINLNCITTLRFFETNSSSFQFLGILLYLFTSKIYFDKFCETKIQRHYY